MYQNIKTRIVDWLSIDLNEVEIIAVKDYKHKKLMWMEVHVYSVKAKSQAGNIWVKDIIITRSSSSHKILGYGS